MRKVISKDGTPIAFDQSGRGSVLILVAGATATRLAEAELAATLASHFMVFAYDRRGRGDSGDRAPYAVEREVEDLDALITEADGTAFVFACASIEEYVLVNTTHHMVETYRRQGKIWAYQHFGPGQQVELGSIGFALPIADLYMNTDVPEREAEEE